MIPSEKLPDVCGIYCVIHRDTGKCYIGSTINLRTRRNAHLSEAKSGSRIHFHRKLIELGIGEFDYEIIERCDKENLLDREKFWMQFYDSTGLNGFNTCDNPHATYDYHHTNSSKIRMSALAIERMKSPEIRAKISKSLTGTKLSPERIAKSCALAMKGKKHSAETKAKMSAASKGKPKSPEHRIKCRLASYNYRMQRKKEKESFYKKSQLCFNNFET